MSVDSSHNFPYTQISMIRLSCNPQLHKPQHF